MSHAKAARAAVKVAVNAVVVATNAVTKHQRLTLPKPRLPMAMHLTSVPNTLNARRRQSQQTLHHKATSPLLAKTKPKNVRPANVAAVTVMAASAVNVLTVLRHRQSKLLTPTPAAPSLLTLQARL